MKSIGILGGVGYKATSYFYERLNHLFELKIGQGNSCPILLQSINFKEINALLPNNALQIANLLKPHVQFFESQNIACGILVNNTMHKALDIILQEEKLKIPYCHVGELIHERLNEIKASKDILILGTAFTMTDNYLQSYISEHHKLVIPNSETIEKADELRKIYIENSDFQKAENCFNFLKESFSENTIFVIACTELSIAFSEIKKPSNWIDTLDLQAEKAIEIFLNS